RRYEFNGLARRSPFSRKPHRPVVAMIPMKVRKALRALVDPRDRRALMQGVVASLEHSNVLRGLPTAKTIIDVGANNGQFILEALKWHPNANFIAFEPLSAQRA